MQIDTKIDPRWCEALLGMLEGDLNYNRVAEVKRMLRIGIDSIRKEQSSCGRNVVFEELKHARRRVPMPIQFSPKVRGCLFSGIGRGNCEHAIGLPGKSVPGLHDGDDDTVDEYGRPNGWCEVCWRGRQIQFLEHALFEYAKAYGGQACAENVVKSAKAKAKAETGILTKDDIKQLSPTRVEYFAYLIEAEKLTEITETGSVRPLYLASQDRIWVWTPDITLAKQFCKRIDAERYAGKPDGTWKIIEIIQNQNRSIL